MKRGVSFEVPNKYGRLLAEVLKPIDSTSYTWKVGDGESYFVVDERGEFIIGEVHQKLDFFFKF